MQKYIFNIIFLVFCLPAISVLAQENDTTTVYKKRVLESIEVDILSSFYIQDGDNAAVSGGIGTESLMDATATIIVSVPLNDDDVLTIDAGVSAYTSASSSNVNPFDGRGKADPFVASSGESGADVWSGGSIAYSHSSDDRNKIWSANISFAGEYDYLSFGGGVGFTRLFNDKNTSLSFSANAFFDNWSLIYPSELRESSGFNRIDKSARNSYSVGLGFSQILSKRMQMSLALDVIRQDGLLSTPFQRVYFADRTDNIYENFHLADDIERLPNFRLKIATGGRVHYYVNEFLTLRSFYRYYTDDWGINSHTASIEMPIKLFLGKITLYPSYRFYNQTAANYFKPYNEHLSTDEFYTSDYDLSQYQANQYGFGISYTDALNKLKVWKIGLKSIDLKYYHYDRNSTFNSNLVTFGMKFVIE